MGIAKIPHPVNYRYQDWSIGNLFHTVENYKTLNGLGKYRCIAIPYLTRMYVAVPYVGNWYNWVHCAPT